MSDDGNQSLIRRTRRRIVPIDPIEAARAFGRVMDADAAGALAVVIAAAPEVPELLGGVFAVSPHLAGLAAQDAGRLARLLTSDPDRVIAALIDAAGRLEASSEAEAMAALRSFKQEAALVAGIADLTKVWETAHVTRCLTEVADALIGMAVRFTLVEAAKAGRIRIAPTPSPEHGCGWIVLGMGKLGAFELNYSSDIDLVVFFDRARVRVAEPTEDIDLFVRMTKRLVKILNDYTVDGYGYRVDLRLRPDPNATPIAIPLEAAFSYYESIGQNWERAAFIKARPVAGDLEAGTWFLKQLAPFVWRRTLDFAAIADIHQIKRLIQSHKGHGTVAVAGHDIKLGRGGIREVEFFVQTQQLILGGVDPRLRDRGTLDALDQLVACGWVAAGVRDELREAYLFLRDVEHRIQMVADEQKHTLPEDADGLAQIGRMMGFETKDDFSEALLAHLEHVTAHYAALFERAPRAPRNIGALSFSSDVERPEIDAALAELGFRDTRMVAEVVRGWHAGRYPATHAVAARQRLAELTPLLLEEFGRTGNGDAALIAFDGMVSRMPAGVQLFSLLAAHPRLLELVAAIVGAAPALADTISRRPRVFGALIDPHFYQRAATDAEVSDALARRLQDAGPLEDVMDRARIFGQEQKFLIGVRVLSGASSVEDAGAAYARLAKVLIAQLFEAVRADFERVNGRIPGGAAAVVGMGKLGGVEMTAASDLDLMLLYDGDTHAESTGGERSVMAPHYYARLTQRLITALSAPTPVGLLYDVDFRLRPSGNKGPIALQLSGFASYQLSEAWTWEHMALTRARVVAGDAAFGNRVAASVRAVLTRRRDPEKLRVDVVEMRQRMTDAKGTDDPWEMKLVPGGLVDIEFVAQYLMLRHAADVPDCLATNTKEALDKLAAAGLLSPSDARGLDEAWRLYQGLTQILRLALEGSFDPRTAPRGLAEVMLRATGEPDLQRVEARLRETQGATRAIFSRILQT